ncbi:lantibiotic dehydratase [Micromonospora sp. CNB394]|uniref:lantibiotic dehydratase n=1 Tax=Micromonospora sp. CNB394 TaxID=1169151 RepID=UPI0003775B59|nr:lantibiotic dehydratase [Micromonospora sp. CNB394]
MPAPPIFRSAGVIMVRATTDPGDLDVPSQLDLASDDAVLREGLPWLMRTWARADVRDALTLASPALAQQLDRISAGPDTVTAKVVRRAAISVAGYLLRWQRRATPFGLFAGVTIAATGSGSVQVGQRHHTVARVDSEWLTAVIDRLEQHPQLRRHLRVIADNTGVVRDGRFITARRADPGGGKAVPLRDASVRYTAPVKAALASAAVGIRYDDLATELAERFPTARPEQITTVLDNLLRQGALISALRPPMTATDDLTHVIETATAAGGEQFGDVAAVLRDLEMVRHLIEEHNNQDDPRRATAVRASLAQRMRGVVAASQHPLAVDTRLDAQVHIPEQVLTEAVEAAHVLLQVSTKPFGSTAWQDYRSRFRARYGQGALVAVRDLLADSGLGYPTGYLGAPRAHPSWRSVNARDATFLALVQRAALDGRDEIVLTDADVEALTVGEPADVIPPARIELGVTVHAASIDALDRGDFRLRFAAAPGSPTSMVGRFIHLFDDHQQTQLQTACAPGSPYGEAVAVQLSFPPRRPHNENVTRVPQLLPDVVALAEHPTGNPISLDDLAVTADADQMYLVQISTGRRVIPHIPHALDTVVQTPPLARFLAEVADARTAVFGPLDVGAARTLPYLPRVRYRRTILAAARWLLTSDHLPSRDGHGWDAALQAWQRHWRVPPRVVLCHGEFRQPLNLDDRLDRALLRHRLAQAERVELREDAQPDDHGWIGRAAELLIPMLAVTPARRPLPHLAQPGRLQVPGGAGVVQARLAGNPARFDDIIRHLASFTTTLDGEVHRWWIRRQRDLVRMDADQHLIVVLRLTAPKHYPAVTAALAAFAADLATRGLPGQMSLVPYQDHPGRYGCDEALAAAEDVFGADTTCVIAQIAAAADLNVPAQALAAASMARLAAAFATDDTSGYQALLQCLPQQTGPLDRALCEQTLRLVDLPTDRRQPHIAGKAVGDAWQARDTTLRRYFDALTTQRDPAGVMPTLLRDHHIRALGVDPTFEQSTNRLARAAALRALARTTQQ